MRVNKIKRNNLTNVARRLRYNETDAERKLWSRLRNKQIMGIKFRRQQPVGKYIVDFVCFEKEMIIEIDGSQHAEIFGITKDIERTKYLESRGFRIVRFWDNDVFNNIEGVLFNISELINKA